MPGATTKNVQSDRNFLSHAHEAKQDKMVSLLVFSILAIIIVPSFCLPALWKGLFFR